MDSGTWLLYLAAAMGLSASPGPNGLLALTHGALHGSRRAMNTILGGALGFVAVIALSAVTNPKALLFFTAFLPQFIDPHRSLVMQFLVMAGTFAIVEIVTEYVLASMANRLRPWLQRVGKRFNRVCGGIFVAIGAALPLRS